MKLIVARYGETLWNVQNKVLGRTDLCLNDIGIKLTEALAEYLNKFKIQIVYASSLKRATQTGKIVAEWNGADLIVLEELIEQNFGIFEGEDWTDKEYQQVKRLYAMRYLERRILFWCSCKDFPIAIWG